jgi:hypothetical protein
VIHRSQRPPSYVARVGSGLVYAAVGLVWVWYIGTRVQHVREDRRTAAEVSGAPSRVVRRASGPANAVTADDPSSVASVRTVVDPVAAARRRAARRAMVRRRRTVLAVLSGLAVAVGVITALGLLPVWAAAPAPLLALGYLAAGSGRRRGRAPAHRQFADGAPRVVDDPSWAGVPYVDVVADWCRVVATPSLQGARRMSGDSHDSHDPGDSDDSGDARSPAVATGPASAGAARIAAPAPGSWRPVPVPLPTYVTAPRVARTVSTIDLESTGAWTSGRAAPPPLALSVGPAVGESVQTGPDEVGAVSAAVAEPSEALEVSRAAAG